MNEHVGLLLLDLLRHTWYLLFILSYEKAFLLRFNWLWILINWQRFLDYEGIVPLVNIRFLNLDQAFTLTIVNHVLEQQIFRLWFRASKVCWRSDRFIEYFATSRGTFSHKYIESRATLKVNCKRIASNN